MAIKSKKEEKGDGLALHNAVKLSPKTIPAIISIMQISNGTLFNYYKEDKLDKEIKEAAAKALGKSVEEIFGTKGANNKGSHINDQPMNEALLSLVREQYQGLLQSHLELIAKIESVKVREDYAPKTKASGLS